ncbi:Uncharacterised protein [Mycobacteroides abscessus subsp. abscessus]|nr:Uncharacterised protein [Mycobacteroides abscessus subsp. abscessus]
MVEVPVVLVEVDDHGRLRPQIGIGGDGVEHLI